ncbi:carboxymuconolactone decarboxylase family protein [Variovorax rhizosphaerae]|uniref:Carboxymuconolactone decarboxylase family protein n=1 Tax=Variovorax rhizosphaerae TaxID=1836200 RepID=A0ABU8WFL5_9BURK
MNSSDFDRGEAMRRTVLGDPHVDRELSNPDQFFQPMQAMVTSFAWGDVWTRDDLPLKTRSLITLAMLIALNRPNELQVHTLGALRNGCSVSEIRGVLMHSAVYCGFPAALDSFRTVSKALKSAGIDTEEHFTKFPV